jgi:PKD domain
MLNNVKDLGAGGAGIGRAPIQAAGVQYYVDPVAGNDTPAGGSSGAPWKTTAYALSRIILLPAESQAGLVLNLKANTLYPSLAIPSTVHGTPDQPMVIQPWCGSRVVFDGGEPRFRRPGAWEPVPGQVDEWRTKETFATAPGERVAWGQIMDTKLRLITYSRIEDMRAANESYQRVPLSDPRPGLPLPDDETHKLPFTYIGPGVYYVFENAEKTVGRVHLRLSSTHMNAPGIQDYVGGGDPNAMNLSIARNSKLAGNIAAQNVVFRNLVFQNGGLSTLSFATSARNLTFDHCEVYGARFGMRIPGFSSGLKFHHCTFDGGLAPWTTRTDVKDSVGSETHDILVIHAANQSEYVNCTFRKGHDALQLVGDQIEVRDSLFEDLNDEVFQYASTVTNVRIHGNVVRQALEINSFHVNPTGGPLYFYRNVVDQRVPTRGYRILPPDAPAPYIWRYGSDFKNGATPPFHVYQNTFLSSHAEDKGSYVSQMFYSDPTHPRTYLNNLHLVLNLDLVLSRVPSAMSPGRADGNIWYRYHPNPEPLFQQPMFLSALGKYFSFAQLWADFPNWEPHSQYADPQLKNFTDEYFEYQSSYPNTDFRPEYGSPADGGGIDLPTDLPEDFSPGADMPDVGARPVDAPVMAVGVDGATQFPATGVPVALAAPDHTIVDANGDGFELVMLDASASYDPDGSVSTYAWTLGGKPVRTSTIPATKTYLPEGEHYLRLVVTDASGNVDSDAVKIRVLPVAPGENRLACPGFEETPCGGWLIVGGTTTSTPGEAHSGARAVRMVQNGLAQRLSQRVPVSPGVYTVSGWLRTQSLANPYAVLMTNLLDSNGAVLQSDIFAKLRGNSPYAYYEKTFNVPETVAFIEVVGALDGSGTGKAFFDDFRIRDRNLLANGRFEVRSPTGQERDAPGWEFGRGGAIVDGPENVRSGRYALALAPYGNYHLIRQTIVHVPGRRYRVSGWVKTTGLDTAPTYNVRFLGASGQNLGTRSIAALTSEGAYTYVSRELLAGDIPAAAALLSVELMLDQVSSGTAFFDDLMVEAIP